MVLMSRHRSQPDAAAENQPQVTDSDNSVPVPLPPADAVTRPWPINPVFAIVIVVVLFFVSQALAAVLVQAVMAVFGWAYPKANTAASAVVQFFFILVAETSVVVGLAAILRRYKLRLADVGLKRPQWKDLGYAIGGFATYFFAYAFTAMVLTQVIHGLNADQKQDVGFGGASGIMPVALTGIALVALAPLAEELLMRGFLFTTLRRRKARFIVATLVTSAIFASAHLAGGEQGAPLLWIAGIDTFVLSLVLCCLREKTGRLWAGIGVHALKNGMAFVFLYILHVAS